jgi:hypothetical protein
MPRDPPSSLSCRIAAYWAPLGACATAAWPPLHGISPPLPPRQAKATRCVAPRLLHADATCCHCSQTASVSCSTCVCARRNAAAVPCASAHRLPRLALDSTYKRALVPFVCPLSTPIPLAGHFLSAMVSSPLL